MCWLFKPGKQALPAPGLQGQILQWVLLAAHIVVLLLKTSEKATRLKTARGINQSYQSKKV